MTNFDNMNKMELRAACKEAGIKNYSKMNNDGMRVALMQVHASVAVQEVKEDDVPATESASVEAEAASKSKGLKIEKDREERNGVKRPSIGGICRAVWDFLDGVVAEGSMPTIGTVKFRAEEEGWNINNASIEFYQWRKFNGIRGRQPKA